MENENTSFDYYDAPRFVDLRNASCDLDDTTDYFFQTNHVDGDNKDKDGNNMGTTTMQESTSIYYSPQHEERFFDIVHTERYNLRKSISTGDLIMFTEEIRNLRIKQESTCDQIREDVQINEEPKNEPKKDSSTTLVRQSNSKCKTNRNGSLDHLNKLAQPKLYGSCDNVTKGAQGKFVSMAEQVSRFQNRTPVRFRSKPDSLMQNFQPSQRTVPESPMLATKLRARPDQHTILSREERELIELQNLQKFKIKANPVNKKILQGPVKPVVPIDKKPATVPAPFNLTEAPPKKVAPSPQKFVFRAQPVMKVAQSPKKSAVHPHRQLTKPITPTFMKNYKPALQQLSSREEAKVASNSETERPRLTKIEPFSFATRDKFVVERREKLIKKVLEEERRAREFHAKPMPKSIYGTSSTRTSTDSIGSGRKCSSKSSLEDVTVNFKARPPTVLYRDPFVPAPSEKSPTAPEPFQLESERRRLERLAFEEKMEEKKQAMELVKQMNAEKMIALEKEEIAKVRKMAEHKAHPVRKFKPLVIQPSAKVTTPISPNFSKNKENVSNNHQG